MGRNETVEFALRARLDDLRKELGKVPGITAKEAKAMAKGLEKEIKAAERAAGKAAEATKSKWNQALKGIEFAALAVAATKAAKETFRVADSVAQYRQEVANAAESTGLATEEIAGMRLAAESAGVSLEQVMAAVDDPSDLEAFIELHRRFGTDVGPEAIESAKEWKSSLTELQMVFKDTAADLFDLLDVSEQLNSFTLGFVYAKEFVTAALDEIATKGADSLKVLELALSGNWEEAAILAQRYRENISVWSIAAGRAERVAKEFYDLREATRETTVATKELKEATDEGAKGHEKMADAIGENREAMTELFGVTIDEQREWLDAQEEAREAVSATNREEEDLHEERLERLGELNDASRGFFDAQKEELKELLSFWAALAKEIGGVLEALADVFKFAREGTEDRIAMLERELGAVEESQRDQVVGAKEASDAVLGIARREHRAQEDLRHSLQDVRADALRAELEETKKQALKLWQAEQAAAISSVVFNTAAAIMAAFAQLGPIAGGVAAAALGVTGGVQIGAILREQPPKYHSGHLPQQLSPTETPAILDRHEGVANRRAMSTPGFRAELEAANRGVPSVASSEHATVLVLNDRVLDVIVTRGLRGQGAQAEVRRVAAGAGSRRRRGGYR